MNNEDRSQDLVITELITEILEEDPSPEEVRTAVDQVKRRLGSQLVSGHSQTESSRSRRSSILRVGIAAAVVGTVTLSLWTPTRQIGGGVAFGQVLDAVRQATSMTYSLIEYPPEGGEDIVQVEVHQSRWLRLVSAGKGTRIIDLQESKLLHFDHPEGQAMHADLFTLVGQAAQALRSACITFTELNDVLPGDGEPLGSKLIDGQAVTGFRIRRYSLVDDREDHSVWEIWADYETAQVVRVDIHHEHDEGRVTLVDFDFDVDFENSLFDLQPPPGYTVHYETIAEIERG